MTCRRLYNTTDPLRAQSLIDLYGVRYIIVGGLERATYSPEGLAKFDVLAQQGLLKPVYQGGAVTIYEVVGHDAQRTAAGARSGAERRSRRPSIRRWNDA